MGSPVQLQYCYPAVDLGTRKCLLESLLWRKEAQTVRRILEARRRLEKAAERPPGLQRPCSGGMARWLPCASQVWGGPRGRGSDPEGWQGHTHQPWAGDRSWESAQAMGRVHSGRRPLTGQGWAASPTVARITPGPLSPHPTCCHFHSWIQSPHSAPRPAPAFHSYRPLKARTALPPRQTATALRGSVARYRPCLDAQRGAAEEGPGASSSKMLI